MFEIHHISIYLHVIFWGRWRLTVDYSADCGRENSFNPLVWPSAFWPSHNYSSLYSESLPFRATNFSFMKSFFFFWCIIIKGMEHSSQADMNPVQPSLLLAVYLRRVLNYCKSQFSYLYNVCNNIYCIRVLWQVRARIKYGFKTWHTIATTDYCRTAINITIMRNKWT